jgi:D-alanine-D-alanine ligase
METVAVIFGGRSTEHDISIITAIASIIKPLELTKKYRVEAVYIAKDGAWYWDDKLKNINLFSSNGITDFLKKSQPASLEFNGGMTLVKTGGIAGRRRHHKIDIVFPAMHGTYGEDGALMGLLDMTGVAYVGCGLSASAIAMDKAFAKQIAVANNLPTPKFLVFSRHQVEKDSTKVLAAIKKDLSYPLFIKPVHLGSSIGLSRVDNDTNLINALETAAHYDSKIIVEQAITNLIEVTLPIIGNKVPQPALLERPLTQAEDFFDFDTKYMKGGKKGKNSNPAAKGAQGYSELPAKLSKELYDQAEKLGCDIYRAFGCSGIARVDMLIDSVAKQVYFNEVNPLPGGLYSHNWRAAGISNVELVERLVSLARERQTEQEAVVTTFSTNYLKQF